VIYVSLNNVILFDFIEQANSDAQILLTLNSKLIS